MVTSHRFLHAWRETAIKKESAILDAWENYGEYTRVILDDADCLFTDLAQKLNLLVYPKDYYSMDGVLYTEKDLVPESPKNQTWLRSITVAFEHENTFNKNVYQEIAHLLILRAELSVLVTYPPSDDNNLMDYFHRIISECPHASEIDKKENFLMIFGYRDPLRWSGYVYKTDRWRSI